MSETPQPTERRLGLKPSILLMDDDVTVQEIGADMLYALGYYPAAAWNGDEAIKLYRQAKEEGRPFDAVILDIMVKDGRGGGSTIEDLRKIDPNVKAIVSSATHGDPLMRNYADYGFKAALPKPYSLRELLVTMEGVLNGVDVTD